MHGEILSKVIFSPAALALTLADGLRTQGAEVTLFSPGPVETAARNVTADLSFFKHELALRGDTYLDLLKKHPFTFITLARQIQSELIAKAYTMATDNQLDIVHVYTNEEETALTFAALCTKPVVFTHHDPFNFLIKYKNLFPKYKSCNWLSMSYAQRHSMPEDTNWVGNIYHGLADTTLTPLDNPTSGYIAYLGRIIEPKGLHLAIEAIKIHNTYAAKPLKLKIAGKHYADHKDTYWRDRILPRLKDKNIEYVGFIDSSESKRSFLGNARALMLPSLFDEPFGMVGIESLACGTPVIGLDSGAIPEVVKDQRTGLVVKKVRAASDSVDEIATAKALAQALKQVTNIDRKVCRHDFEDRFTAQRMCQEHLEVYRKLIG